jgi:hypothetical protein
MVAHLRQAFWAALIASSVLGVAACAETGSDTANAAATTPAESSAVSGSSQPGTAPAGTDITARYPAYRFIPPFLRPQDR